MWLSRNNFDTGRGHIDDWYVLCVQKPDETFNRDATQVQRMDNSGITYVKVPADRWEASNPQLKMEPGAEPIWVTVVPGEIPPEARAHPGLKTE